MRFWDNSFQLMLFGGLVCPSVAPTACHGGPAGGRREGLGQPSPQGVAAALPGGSGLLREGPGTQAVFSDVLRVCTRADGGQEETLFCFREQRPRRRKRVIARGH